MLQRIAVALLLLAMSSYAASAQKRIALLIGNQGYSAKVGPLTNPHNDVTLIGAALQRLGFKTTIIKDADYRSTDAAIKRHIATVRQEGPGTISFFYYSGHGAADPNTRINYLIPVDVAQADDAELWNYSINLNSVIQGLRTQTSAATHYVVFDACRNALNLTRSGQKSLTDKGFVPIAYTPGVMVAYATAPGRTASDAGIGGGTYAKALADEIMKPGVDSLLVFTRVARRVNREIGQDPFLSASTMPEVYFAGQANTFRSMLDDDAPAPQPSEAERTWAMTKDTTSIAILEAFVDRYRSTAYADLARARIGELKRLQPAPTPTSLPRDPAAGRDCDQEQDNDRRIQGCTELIRQNPKDAQAISNRGIAHARKSQHYPAIADFTKVIELHPKHTMTYVNRGLVYTYKGDHAQAIVDFTKAIELDPKHASAYANRGEAYRRSKDIHHAIVDLTKAIELDPKNRVAYHNRALAHGSSKEYDRAVADLTRAIELDGKQVSAYYARGEFYRLKTDHHRAIADYAKVIELDGRHASAHTGRGLVYAALKDHARAIADYTRAIELDPREARPFAYRGWAYGVMNRKAEAAADFRRALAIDPSNETSKDGLARLARVAQQ